MYHKNDRQTNGTNCEVNLFLICFKFSWWAWHGSPLLLTSFFFYCVRCLDCFNCLNFNLLTHRIDGFMFEWTLFWCVNVKQKLVVENCKLKIEYCKVSHQHPSTQYGSLFVRSVDQWCTKINWYWIGFHVGAVIFNWIFPSNTHRESH